MFQDAALTDADDRLFEFWCRHSFKHARANVSQVIKISIFDCTLLNLELRASCVRGKNGLNPFLLPGACRWSRGKFGKSGKDELPHEVIGIRRVERRDQ